MNQEELSQKEFEEWLLNSLRTYGKTIFMGTRNQDIVDFEILAYKYGVQICHIDDAEEPETKSTVILFVENTQKWILNNRCQ